MNFSIKKEENYAVVKSLCENIDMSLAPELKSIFLQLTKEGLKNIVFDISKSSYCDSSGLGALLTGHRLCEDKKGKFIIVGVKDMVKKLIEISQLDNVLNILNTKSEAVDMIFLNELEKELKNE